MPKIDMRGNTNQSLQNKQTTVSGGCGTVSKREGWKADQSLKNFDDNVLNMIESEVRYCACIFNRLKFKF